MSTSIQTPEPSSSTPKKSKKRKYEEGNVDEMEAVKRKKAKKKSKSKSMRDSESVEQLVEEREVGEGERVGKSEKKDKRETKERGLKEKRESCNDGGEKKKSKKDRDKKDKREKKKKHRDEDDEGTEKRNKTKSRKHDKKTQQEGGSARVNGEHADTDDDGRSEKQKKQRDKKDKKKDKDGMRAEDGSLNGVEEDEIMLDDSDPATTLDQEDDDGDTELNGLPDQPETASTSSTADGILGNFLDSPDPSCFYSTRISLHLSIPAVALSTALNSIMAMHLTPLLLTYFPPVRGVVLAFTDPVLSTTPYAQTVPAPQPSVSGTLPLQQDTSTSEVLAKAADDFGAAWAWLTVTFLVFRPRKGDTLRAWSNVASHGFVGCLSYNLFQISVGKERIPEGWRWEGPVREARSRRRKGKLRDDDADEGGSVNADGSTRIEQEVERPSEAYISDGAGFFVDAIGKKMEDNFDVRVVDVDMVPDRDRWTLHVDGTLLDEEAELALREKERGLFEKKSSLQEGGDVEMSGGVGVGEGREDDAGE